MQSRSCFEAKPRGVGPAIFGFLALLSQGSVFCFMYCGSNGAFTVSYKKGVKENNYCPKELFCDHVLSTQHRE